MKLVTLPLAAALLLIALLSPITAGAVVAGLPGTLLAVPLTAAAHAALQRTDLPARRRPREGPG